MWGWEGTDLGEEARDMEKDEVEWQDWAGDCYVQSDKMKSRWLPSRFSMADVIKTNEAKKTVLHRNKMPGVYLVQS
jgi:hypothetical protein